MQRAVEVEVAASPQAMDHAEAYRVDVSFTEPYRDVLETMFAPCNANET